MKKVRLLIVLIVLSQIGCSRDTFAQRTTSNSQFKGPFSLSLKPGPGPARYYRSRTLYNTLGDVDGAVLNSFVVMGDYKRQFVGLREDGCAMEEFEWQNVRIAHLPVPDGKQVASHKLPFAEHFTYRICFNDHYATVMDVVDYSKLPRTVEGVLFYEQILDSHSPFDLALTRSHGPAQKLRFIGDESKLPPAENHELDFRPFGSFHFSRREGYTLRLIGLTTRDGQEAAIINFGELRGPGLFDSNMKIGNQVITQRLTTQTWGTMVVSLHDGFPLWSTLLERVDNLSHCQDPKNPTFGYFRQVVVETISKAEFEAGLGK